MKRLMLMAMLVGCIACNKNSSNNNTEPNNPSNNNNPTNNGNSADDNTLTLNDNGKVIEVKGKIIKCDIYTRDSSTCYLEFDDETQKIELSLKGLKKGDNPVGLYLYSKADNKLTPQGYFYMEPMNQAYKTWFVDSAVINITSAAENNSISKDEATKGTFKAWLESNGDKKVISGEFTTFD